MENYIKDVKIGDLDDLVKKKVQESNQNLECPSNANIINEMNQKHAVVSVEGKFAIVNEKINPANGYQDIDFSTVKDFNDFYLPFKAPGGDHSVAVHWLNSYHRRQYKDC